jgi:hypothetical protein
MKDQGADAQAPGNLDLALETGDRLRTAIGVGLCHVGGEHQVSLWHGCAQLVHDAASALDLQLAIRTQLDLFHVLGRDFKGRPPFLLQDADRPVE